MKGLRFDASGWLGLYFPHAIESGWSTVDNKTEVVEEPCVILAEHLGRYIDVHGVSPGATTVIPRASAATPSRLS
jgi:hypothetical protein